jgi:hypothetical protein
MTQPYTLLTALLCLSSVALAQVPIITTISLTANAQAARISPLTVTFSQPLIPRSAAALKVYSAQWGGVEPVSVYPNPAHGSFAVTMLSVTGERTMHAELINTLGQVVHHQLAALPVSGTSFSVPTRAYTCYACERAPQP